MFKIEELMNEYFELIDENETIPNIFQMIASSNLSYLLVNCGNKGIRIINLNTIAKTLNDHQSLEGLTAVDLTEKDAIVISCNSTWSTLEKALRNNYTPLLVVDGRGKKVGVVDEVSLIKGLFGKAKDLRREIDAIINYSNDWVFVSDGKGIAQHINTSFEKDFGVKVENIIGKNVKLLEKEKVFYPSVTKQVLRNKKPQTVLQLQRDGRKLLASGTPVFNDDGSIFRVIVNVRDVTKLNELKQQLEEVERLKELYYQEIIDLHHDYSANPEIVVCSPAMVKIYRTAKKVATVDSTILISGETGSGKGVIARYIHDCSLRKGRPFVTVNCGSIPENLIESELFGYVKGAFTGARTQGKIGKIELANHGTLFMDEITELPLNLQVKLLHVIQDGIINRIGDAKDIQLDLRIIAATNRDILKMVSKGGFREDLYFRLNVIPLEVPSLRDRIEDIEPLSRHFLDKANQKYGMDKKIDVEVYDYLCLYHWPGNVRELENLIERLVVIADSNVIQTIHLPEYIYDGTKEKDEMTLRYIKLQPLEQAKELLENKLLNVAVKQCKSTYEIAEILKINQSTVVRKLRKHNLNIIN